MPKGGSSCMYLLYAKGEIQMTITEEKNGDVLTVKIEGHLNTLSSPHLEHYLKCRYDGIEQLVLDLEKVDYISSAGVRVLIQVLTAMRDKRGLLLKNVCEQVNDILTLTGYINVLKVK